MRDFLAAELVKVKARKITKLRHLLERFPCCPLSKGETNSKGKQIKVAHRVVNGSKYKIRSEATHV